MFINTSPAQIRAVAKGLSDLIEDLHQEGGIAPDDERILSDALDVLRGIASSAESIDTPLQ